MGTEGHFSNVAFDSLWRRAQRKRKSASTHGASADERVRETRRLGSRPGRLEMEIFWGVSPLPPGRSVVQTGV